MANVNFYKPHQSSIAEAMLDMLRRTGQGLGRDLNVTSGYRSPAYNRKVRGARGSYHTKGLAVDIDMTGMSEAQRAQLAELLVRNGAGGLITYSGSPNMLHVDMRPQRDGRAHFMHDKTARNMHKAPAWFRQLSGMDLKGEAGTQVASAGGDIPLPTRNPRQTGGLAALLSGRTPDEFMADRQAQRSAAAPASRQQEAYEFFVSRGVPPAAAAGIVGNLDVESGGFADDVIAGTRRGDGGSAGYVPQLRGDRLAAFENWAAQTQQDPRSLDTQLGFVLEQMNPQSRFNDPQSARIRDALWGAQTPDEATRIFMEGFERPHPDYAHLDRRLAAAQKVFSPASRPPDGNGFVDAIPVAAGNVQAVKPDVLQPLGTDSAALTSPVPMEFQTQPVSTVPPADWGAQTQQAMMTPQPTPGAQPFAGADGFGMLAGLLSGLASMGGGGNDQQLALPPEQKPVDGLLPAPELRTTEPLPEAPAGVARAPEIGLDGSGIADIFMRLRNRPQASGSLFRPTRIG